MSGTLLAREASWGERSSTVAVFLALGIAVGTWASAIPVLKAALGLSAAQLGIVLLVLALASTLSTLATGALAPRFGTGRSTGASAVATVVAFALPAFARDYPQLLLCAVAIGLAVGALDIAVNAHASEIERRWRAPIMSSFHGAFSVGGLTGAGLGGLLAATGWSLAGQIGVPLLVASFALAAAAPRLGPGVRTDRGEGTTLALPERRALPVCMIALLCFLLEGAMADWSAVYLTTVGGATAGVSAAGYAAFSITMAGGRFVGDAVVKRLGAGRTVFYGGAVATAGMAVALVVPQPFWGAVGFALVGIGASNIVPVAFSRAGRFGATPSAGVAMVATFGYAGFLGGPPVIGALAEAAGLRAAMAVVLLAPLAAMLLARSLDAPDR